MPLVDIHIIEGVFNATDKQQMISKITNSMVAIEGENLRGALAMDDAVAVGFQAITCEIHFSTKQGTSPGVLRKLQSAAQPSCVVQQTMNSLPKVNTTFRQSSPARLQGQQTTEHWIMATFPTVLPSRY